jgi:hypothetical protein
MTRKLSKEDKEAIEAFKSSLSVLDIITDRPGGNIWKARVRDNIVKYLGTESPFLGALADIHFTRKINPTTGHPTSTASEPFEYRYEDGKKADFRVLLGEIIERIRERGTMTKEKPNFMSDMGTVAFLGTLGGAAVVLVGVTVWIVAGIVSGQKSEAYQDALQKIDKLEKNVAAYDTLLDQQGRIGSIVSMELQEYQDSARYFHFTIDSLSKLIPLPKSKK